MKAAYDVGINFFDCAEGYAGGESERVMGQAIKKFDWKRNDLVISTKVSIIHSFKFHPIPNLNPRSTGAKPMAKSPSTMAVYLENTLSKA